MKKVLCVILAAMTVFSLCACGSKIEDEAWDELEKLGGVYNEKGTKFAYITMPADFSSGATQELLDATSGEMYTAARLNEDGSITYKLTKKQHKGMLDDFQGVIDDSIKEMLDNSSLAYTDIKPGKGYSVFDVTLSNEELGDAEMIMNTAFFIYGELYGIFNGHSEDNITVNYYGPGGSLITSSCSAETN